MASNAPWYPEYGPESREFMQKLRDEKYNGHVDQTGIVRWSSEWRMHRANGMNALDATVAVFKSIDAIRAGQQPPPNPPGPYDAQWLPVLDAESVPFVDTDLPAIYKQNPAGAQDVDDEGWVRWSSDFRNHRDNGFSYTTAVAKIQNDIFKIWGVVVPATETRRPLVGPLRQVNKLFADNTGYRRVFGDSDFTSLWQLKYDPAAFYDGLDDSVRAGFQTRREFMCVGGWMGYWDGKEIPPLDVTYQKWYYDGNTSRPGSLGTVIKPWPDFRGLFRTLLQEHRKRKLRLHITFGDVQIIMPDPNVEIAVHDELARIAAEEGGSDVIALWEVTNEIPFNRQGGLSDASIEQIGRVIATVRKHLPDVLCASGAACSEEPKDLLQSAKYGQVCTAHTTREPFSLCLKRTMSLVYWEGQYRSFPLPLWQGEPKGPNVGPMDGIGDDMYQPTYDTAEIVALYSMHALTGQASNFFDGAAVRNSGESEDAWGYDELPLLFEEFLPEDIATWDHGSNQHGGIEYWWKGKDFRTSTWKEWDTTPPRPIATWKLYDGKEIKSGTGTPPKCTGLLVGTFE